MSDTQPQVGGSEAASALPKSLQLVVKVCDAITRWSLRILAVLVPLFFLPWTIEVAELNKQMLLLVVAGVAGLAWVGKMLAEKKVEYRRSVVNMMVLLFLAVYVISAVISESPYMSLVGDFGQEKSGLVTVGALVLLYFVTINNIKTAKDLNRLFLSFVVGGFVAALYALLQGLGAFILPFGFSKSASFNTVGTVAALCVYLAFIISLAGGMLLSGHKQPTEAKKTRLVYNIFLILTSVLSLVLVALVDFWPVTVSLLVASLLLIGFSFVHARSIKSLSGVILPISVLVVTLLLLIFRFPVSLKYPAEIMPSMKATADIAMKTLRERPFFGSGPGTFIFDYSKFHAAEVNQSMFWNVRFDRGASRFLTMLATNGLLGALSWLLVALFLLVAAGRKLLKADEETWHVLIGIFSAWFLLVLSKFLYSSTIVLEFASWMTMALLVVVYSRDMVTVKFENSPRAAMGVSFMFILGTVAALSGLFVEGQRYAGEVHYAQAIQADQAGEDVDKVIDGLAKAADMNKANDVYIRNLSLALLAKANKVAAQPIDTKKAEGETDEAYEQRMQTAQQEKIRMVANLAANAVNVAKQSSDMNPSNVANWSVLATIYQNLFGVTEGADEWAAKSFSQAIELEPANPSLHTELGKVYLYQADVASQALQSKDEKVKKDAETKVNDLLAKAVDSFNKAIELKSDFAAARFNLALALDRQGKLKDAIGKMEEVITLNPRDVGVGFQLALMYYRDGRKDEAMGLLSQVIALEPSYSNARWYLAAMFEEKGDLDKAIEQIKKVDELNPNTDIVKKKLSDLTAKKSGAAAAVAAPPLPPPVDQPVQNPKEPSVQKR